MAERNMQESEPLPEPGQHKVLLAPDLSYQYYAKDSGAWQIG
jgi:hypothetical protein